MQNKTMLTRLRERADGESGFTLIELLIVITILGILAAIVVFAVGTSTSDATSAACKADVATAQTAVEAYAAQNDGAFPATLTVLTTAAGGHGPWLRTVPTDVSYAAGTGTVSCS